MSICRTAPLKQIAIGQVVVNSCSVAFGDKTAVEPFFSGGGTYDHTVNYLLPVVIEGYPLGLFRNRTYVCRSYLRLERCAVSARCAYTPPRNEIDRY